MRRFIKEQRGSSMIETALSLMITLVMIFSIIEFCSAIYTYVVLQEAANEGMRYAIVNANNIPEAVRRTKIYAGYSLHNVDAMTVTAVPSICGTCTPVCATALNGTPGCPLIISISYPYLPYLAWIMPQPPTMTAHS